MTRQFRHLTRGVAGEFSRLTSVQCLCLPWPSHQRWRETQRDSTRLDWTRLNLTRLDLARFCSAWYMRDGDARFIRAPTCCTLPSCAHSSSSASSMLVNDLRPSIGNCRNAPKLRSDRSADWYVLSHRRNLSNSAIHNVLSLLLF